MEKNPGPKSSPGISIENFWDSPLIRATTGDFLTLGGKTEVGCGVGFEKAINAVWILHGPDKSIFPYFTIRVGVMGHVGANSFAGDEGGQSWYLGPADEISRDLLTTNSLEGALPTIEGGFGIGKVASGGVGFSFTPLRDRSKQGVGIIGYALQAGVGAGASFSGGVSNTIELKKTNP